jgi:hypothetical protein
MIKFNEEAFLSHMHLHVSRKLGILCEYAAQKMRGYLEDIGGNNPVGAPEWRYDVIQAVKVIVLTDMIGVGRQVGVITRDFNIEDKAMLINYGMGVDLLKSNPFLSEYMRNTAYYDSKRKDFKVYRREGEMVYDYNDGVWYESTAQGHGEIPHFHQKASLFFEQVLIELKDEFEALKATIYDDVDMSQFLIIE